MITISDGKLTIPESERFIGFAGDNLHSTKRFFLSGITTIDWLYRIYLTFDDRTCNYFTLDSSVSADGTTLTWNVLRQHIFKSGIVFAQIKAFSASANEIYHTTTDAFIVGVSSEESECFTSDNAEFLEYEQQLNSLKEYISGARVLTPYIGENGNWFIFDSNTNQYTDSGKPSVGQSLTADIADSAVTTPKIAGFAVTADKLAIGAVESAGIAEGAVVFSKLADGAVRAAKIADGAVTSAKLADDAVTPDKLDRSYVPVISGDGAPTAGTEGAAGSLYFNFASGDLYVCKGLGWGAYRWELLNGGGAIADGAVTTAKLADDAVTGDKIADRTVNSNNFNQYGVQAVNIQPGAVTIEKIANDAVTPDKLDRAYAPAVHNHDSAYSAINHMHTGMQSQTIADAAEYYVSDTVEGALAEIGAELDGLGTVLEALL